MHRVTDFQLPRYIDTTLQELIAECGDCPDPAVRSIHLQGGCRANDVKGKLVFELLTSNGEVAQLVVANFYHAYAALRGAGFPIIGADFYFELERVDGRRLPSWRAYHPVGVTSWPCAEQADQWSFIAHAAIRVQNGLLWDVASRVSYQMRVCDWRLRQVSESYRDQLHATVRSRAFDEGLRFQDGFTWLGYLAIHAFLVDACILRDYLANTGLSCLLSRARRNSPARSHEWVR